MCCTLSVQDADGSTITEQPIEIASTGSTQDEASKLSAGKVVWIQETALTSDLKEFLRAKMACITKLLKANVWFPLAIVQLTTVSAEPCDRRTE